MFSVCDREAIEGMLKVGEINASLKELEVALELSDLSRQDAEKESVLAKEKAENLLLEVKRLEQMVNILPIFLLTIFLLPCFMFPFIYNLSFTVWERLNIPACHMMLIVCH